MRMADSQTVMSTAYHLVTDRKEEHKIRTQLYIRRWVVLFIFVLSSLSNAWQWIQYVIVSNIIEKYYGVSNLWVEWTSMVYMVTYITFIFPALFLLDKLGLRVAAILGAFGTALGTWIKVASVTPDRFLVTFAGQALVATSQVFILSVPPRLAAVWFGPDQVSTACSIGVFGNQLGIAVGFLLTPLLVRNHENIDDIGADLSTMFYIMAAFTSFILVLVLLFFKKAPPLPPSLVQAAKSESSNNVHKGFLASMKRLMFNRGYVLLLVSYGINVGAFFAISTMLNHIILTYFLNGEEFAGRVGVVLVLSGTLGSVVCGVVLDKTHKFKETTLAVYICSLLGMVIYTFTLGAGSQTIIYFSAGILGFFMTGYLPIGFEFAAEMTYPEPETTSAGLLNVSTQIFGVVFTMSYSYFIGLLGDMWANVVLCATLFTGTILTALIKSKLRRQTANAINKLPDFEL